MILLVSGETYLALNSRSKPQPIAQNPTPTSIPTPTIDPTSNWKTLTNDKSYFSFKYPDQIFKYTNISSPNTGQFFFNGTVDKEPTPGSLSMDAGVGQEFGIYKTIESYADYRTRSVKDSKQKKQKSVV